LGNRKIPILVLAVFFIAISVSSCSGQQAGSAELDYMPDTITVSGLEDDDITISIKTISDMESVSVKAKAQKSNGDIVKTTAKGPTLKSLAEQHDRDLSEFSSVRVSSKDGYSVAIPKEIIEKSDIILSYMDGKKPLSDTESPLRIVVIGERAMYWVRMVDSITFETGEASTQVMEIFLLDTVLPGMKQHLLEDDEVNAVSTVDLFDKFNTGASADKVKIVSSDGLIKNETIENFFKGFLTTEGKNAPRFCSPEFPVGMSVDNVSTIIAGDLAFCSPTQLSRILDKKMLDGHKGISFTDITGGLSFVRAPGYTVTSETDEELILTENQLADSILFEEGGSWYLCYPGGDLVKDPVSISGFQQM